MNATHQTARPASTPRAEERRHGDGHPGHGEMDGMVEVARENDRFHLAPAPGAAPPLPEPFPRPVVAGLLLGAAVGALVGFVFARLLLNGSVTVPEWEQLFSMSPGTFSTFWVGTGIALGIVGGGVGTILLVPAHPDSPDRREPERR